MTKIARNDPCACGSGKKYKKCCMKNDDAERVKTKIQREADIAAAASLNRQKRIDAINDIDNFIGGLAGTLMVDDELALLSNSIIDLIEAEQFDEAEIKCNELLTNYPDVVDGYDRFAMLYEKRGDPQKAAEYYQKASDFMQSSSDYAQESIDFYRDKVVTLSKLAQSNSSI